MSQWIVNALREIKETPTPVLSIVAVTFIAGLTLWIGWHTLDRVADAQVRAAKAMETIAANDATEMELMRQMINAMEGRNK